MLDGVARRVDVPAAGRGRRRYVGQRGQRLFRDAVLGQITHNQLLTDFDEFGHLVAAKAIVELAGLTGLDVLR